MSQIIITGDLRFEDVKLLVEMLPTSDQLALKNYLLVRDNLDRTTRKKNLIDRFRSHTLNEQQIDQAVKDAIEEVRHVNSYHVDNFGRFQNDPIFDDFLAEMEAYRRELDQEEGIQA